MKKNKELTQLIEEFTEDDSLYINLKDIVEHFVEVNEYFNNEPWNINQILTHIGLMIPIKHDKVE